MRRFFLILILLSGCQALPSDSGSIALPNRLIAFWETATGTLAAADAVQPFQFVGQQSDAIRASVSGEGNYRLTLLSTDGTVLTEAANPLDAVLPASGIYTLRLQASAGGAYRLSLAYTDRLNPADATATPRPTAIITPSATPPYYARLGTFITTISAGDTPRGSFDAPEVQHVYTFDGQADTYVGIEVQRVSGTVDPVLHLYAPDGSELASDDNTGGNRTALLRNVKLPADGVYSLQVWGRGFAGGYQLRLSASDAPALVTPIFQPTASPTPVMADALPPTAAPAIAGELLVDHVPVLGVIERQGDFDRYPIAVTQGQVITLAVRPDARFRAKLELFDPDGLLIASVTPADSAAGGDALIPALLAGQTGIYMAFVTGEANSIGGYSIAYGAGFSHTDTRRGPTAADQLYSGSINRRGLSELWSLDLNGDDVITIVASVSSGAIDPVLELLSPDSALVAMDDNSAGSRDAQIVSARVPVSGRYQIRVSSANATGEGTYAMIWRIISRLPTPTPPPGFVPLLAFDDAASGSTYQYYTFYGQAGTMVEVMVAAKPGSGLDAVAALLAPDGSVIAEGDDDGTSSNPRFTARLPVDGTYRVRVNGYLSSGAFTLTVNALYSP